MISFYVSFYLSDYFLCSENWRTNLIIFKWAFYSPIVENINVFKIDVELSVFSWPWGLSFCAHIYNSQLWRFVGGTKILISKVIDNHLMVSGGGRDRDVNKRKWWLWMVQYKAPKRYPQHNLLLKNRGITGKTLFWSSWSSKNLHTSFQGNCQSKFIF